MEKNVGPIHLPQRCGISTVCSKQNKLSLSPEGQQPKSPRIMKSQSVYPQQEHTHWTTSTGSVFPLRMTSPNNIPSPASPRKMEIIYLGGKQNRHTSRDSFQPEDSGRSNLSPDATTRKISMLQSRIKELHREKQQTVIDLNQRINKLQFQNDRLNAELYRQQAKIASKNTFDSEEFDHTHLEEMLSNQISINLELRDNLDEMNKKVQALEDKAAEWEIRYNKNQAEKNELIRIHKEAISIEQKEKEIFMNKQRALEEKLRQIEELKMSRNTAIEALIQQQEKRIMELQEQSGSRASCTQLKEREISTLEQELTAQKLDSANLKEKLEAMKAKLIEAESQECKKCKDMMHTIFRLNSQLNKK